MWDIMFTLMIAFLGFIIPVYFSINMSNMLVKTENITGLLFAVSILCGIVSASTAIIFLKLNDILKQLKSNK